VLKKLKIIPLDTAAIFLAGIALFSAFVTGAIVYLGFRRFTVPLWARFFIQIASSIPPSVCVESPYLYVLFH